MSTTTTDPAVLNGWFVRGYNMEYTVSAQHQLSDQVSVNGGYYRRTFGNQTFTDDLRYTKDSYDGPFCITAPSDANLPNGGNYQVCGLYDLKPSVFAQNQPANSLVRSSIDFGGETNMYQGFDLNLDARFPHGAFLRGGISATGRTFDNCNLIAAGPDASRRGLAAPTVLGTEMYADGTSTATASMRFVRTSSCSAPTRCRSTSSSAARTSSAVVCRRAVLVPASWRTGR